MPTERHEDVAARLTADMSPEGRGQVDAFKYAFSVGAQLATRRRELGLTQAEVSARSGVQQADVSRIERGVVVPSISTVTRLAGALDARWALVDAASPPAA